MTDKTPKKILKELVEDHGIRVEKIAVVVGCSCDTVYRWRRGATPILHYAKRLEKLYDRTLAKQRQVVGPEKPAPAESPVVGQEGETDVRPN